MANGHGGKREGAGRKHRDLHEVIDYREIRDSEGNVVDRIPVTVMGRIEEAIRAGGFLHDAAARVGVTVETLRDWRRQGMAANADVLNGRKRRSQLTKWQRMYAQLAQRMETAEAEARLQLLGVGQQLARGGLHQRETITRTVAAMGGRPATVEVVEKESVSPPDSAMIRWLLQHRWPNDFAGRVELTGPHGDPVQLDTTPHLQKLRDLIHETNHNNTQTTPNTPEPHTNGHKTPTP